MYDMSRAGTLMVNSPNVPFSYIQQVYTDESGKVSVSRMAPVYEPIDESNNDIAFLKANVPGEGEEKPPKVPEKRPVVPDPTMYSLFDAPPGNLKSRRI